VVPATAGLALQAVSFVIYAQLTLSSPLWLVIVPSVISGVGAGAFFPANTSAVMKAAPRRVFGIASGMLRTFANIGMVFSFTVAILVAAHSIPRGLAFAIFVGSTSLHGRLAAAFVSGVHAAFYSATALVAIAALLSALRGRRGLVRRTAAEKPAAGAAG
jgi:MFS family permease